MHLLALPQEDVLFPHIFQHLSVVSLFLLRGTCRSMRDAVDCYWGKLKCLNLAGNNSINKQAVQVLVDNVGGLSELDLAQCKWAEDASVRPLIGASPRMRSLSLAGCQSLGNPVIQSIAVTCKMPFETVTGALRPAARQGLRRLVLRDCCWLSPPAMQVMNYHLHQLVELDLAGCWGVNDATLAELFSSQPHLEEVSVSRIYSLTDRTVALLASCCPRLRRLALSGCWRVTDNGITYVVEYLRQLTRLDVTDCRDVTERTLRPLRLRCEVDRPPPPPPNPWEQDHPHYQI